MSLYKTHTVFDIVKDWDLEQIAQDHINVMLESYEQGFLDSYIDKMDLSTSNIKEDIND